MLKKISNTIKDKKNSQFIYWLLISSALFLIIGFTLENLSKSFSLNLKILNFFLFFDYFFYFVFIFAGFLVMIKFILKNAPLPKDKKIFSRKIVIGLLITIIIIGGGLRLYRLGADDFREDEFQVNDAAAGFFYTGDFYKWNWTNAEEIEYLEENEYYYDRAWPHTLLIALNYKIFGVSEWSARLPSAIFGVLLLLLAFLIFNFFFENKWLALAISLSFSLNPDLISLSRYARMYIIMIPLFLLTAYFVWRFLTEKNTYRFFRPSSWLDFNYKYFLLLTIVIVICVLLQITSLVILPIVYFYIIYLALKTEEKKYLFLLVIGAVLILLALLLGFSNRNICFFCQFNIDYFAMFFDYPFDSKLGFLFFMIALFSLLFTRKNLRAKILYLFSYVILGLLVFIFLTRRYVSYNYVSHLIIFSIPLIIYGYFCIAHLIGRRLITAIFAFFLIFNISLSFYRAVPNIYQGKNNYGRYSEAYQNILSASQPDDILIGLYPRKYYLAGLDSINQTYFMGPHGRYSLKKMLEQTTDHHGWVTWESRKSYHLNPEVISYLCNNFWQITGSICGVKLDDSNVEIFYFYQAEK